MRKQSIEFERHRTIQEMIIKLTTMEIQPEDMGIRDFILGQMTIWEKTLNARASKEFYL